MHLLLQSGEFGQVAQETDRPADFFVASANRGNGDSEVAALPGGGCVLHLLAAENLSFRQALGHQARQFGRLTEGLAVAAEAQCANAQCLLGRGISAGDYSGGVDDQKAGGHVACDFFA